MVIRLAGVAALAAALTFSATAFAADHTVEMRNKNDAGQNMAFQPAFLKVEVGDTVTFVPTDKNHNAESIPQIWPEGVTPVKGAMNAKVEFKAEKDGLYVFKCAPHYGMGMIALIQVGKPTNLEAVKGFKALGVSGKRLTEELTKVIP